MPCPDARRIRDAANILAVYVDRGGLEDRICGYVVKAAL